MSTSPPSDHAFERDFCSNFTCCGLSLADLHTLLDHFEEAHVFVVGSNIRPAYPTLPFLDDCHTSCPSPSTSDGSLSPCSTSYVVDYPHTSSPAKYVSGDHYHPSRLTAGEDLDLFSTTDNGMWTSSATIADFEFDFDFKKNRLWESFPDDDDDDDDERTPYSSPPTSDDADDEEEKEDLLPLATESPSFCSIIRDLVPEILHADLPDHSPIPLSPLKPVVSPKQKMASGSKPITPARSRRGAREKTFKCPHNGCTKSYLNPNGLKYHLEKGTCEIGPKDGKE